MQGFFLGLSSGAVCAAYCAPVLVPYLLGERRSVVQNFSALLQFLTGRLLGYLAFAIFAVETLVKVNQGRVARIQLRKTS